MIEVTGIEASIGRFALREVSFKVATGGALALLGPSGAGKTLLLECLLGLRPHRRGTVLIDGVDVTDAPPERRRVAYMPQDVALFPHLSVRENILFGRAMQRAEGDTAADLSLLSKLLELEPLMSRAAIQTLSGGEKQRVALARALMVNPRVLFLDESFSSLDLPSRDKLVELFRKIQRELRITTIYVTHSRSEAARLGDDVAVVMDGRVVQHSPADRLFRAVANDAVARFLGLENIFRVERVKGRRCWFHGVQLSWDGGALPAHSPEQGFLALEAEELPEDAGEGLPNVFRGVVAAVRPESAQAVVRLAQGAEPRIVCRVSLRTLRRGALRVGGDLRVHVPPGAVVFFPAQ